MKRLQDGVDMEPDESAKDQTDNPVVEEGGEQAGTGEVQDT